jgi:hypothetical protein
VKPALILRLASVAILIAAGIAFAQGAAPLTNDDIVKMTQAKLSSSIILTTIESATTVRFDVSPAALIALKDAGVADPVIASMLATARAQSNAPTPAAAPVVAEKSDSLADAKEPDAVLRGFKTLLVDASRAQFFGSDQMKAALGKHKGFETLRITIVDDRSVADAVLEVSYTFAWDYPFSLKHQNSSVVLVSGKGTGPLSGPGGAASVASEFVKLLRPYRTAPAPAAKF